MQQQTDVSNDPKVEHFQRKLTSAERFFTRSPFSIVTMVARIKGHVNEKDLKAAIRKAQKRHAPLRARITDEVNYEQWFTTKDVLEVPLQVFPRKKAGDWIEIHAEASTIPYDFEERPAIRFILVQAPAESDLIILCHHMICDGMSLAYLARDLMRYLGEPAYKEEPLPAPPPIDLDNLPADISQSRIAKLLIGRMNRQWAEERVGFDQSDYETLTAAYWANFHHKIISIELPEEETSILVGRCRSEQVTVNSALTAAFCGAQSLVEGERAYHEKIVVAADLRDRLPKPVGQGIGMYAGGVELDFKYNHKKSFWDNARSFHKKIRPKYTNKILFRNILNWLYLDPTIFEAMNFKKLGHLVSRDTANYEKLVAFSQQKDIVLRLLKRDQLESLATRHWGTAVTNLGRLDFPKTYGSLELERLIMQPGGGIPLANANLVLGVVTCSGKLSLVIEYAEQAVTTTTMVRIKDKGLEFLFGE